MALLPLVNRATVKPLLTVLVLVAASVSYFTSHYGTYFDTHMIDNVLQTDSREASELLTPGFALYLLLFALLPLTLLWRWPLRQCGWQRSLGAGALWWLSSVTVLAGVLLFSFQGLSALMRNHHGPCSTDHGESLGENGLYLHVLLYAIAPQEQTRVPMVWWTSDHFARSIGLNETCLATQRDNALSHDNLFHSLLGLLGVESRIREDTLDLSAGCRASRSPTRGQGPRQ
ncbi:phosphoethanolamine transferase domain-containing protein [Halomonas salifodinae]|uniref:Phosphoethanolamine transferase domain-containing protein n=1 Tax=Halomonas salifodinae TaxID=438745 RepID=A0ABW2ETK8_9GAMM